MELRVLLDRLGNREFHRNAIDVGLALQPCGFGIDIQGGVQVVDLPPGEGLREIDTGKIEMGLPHRVGWILLGDQPEPHLGCSLDCTLEVGGLETDSLQGVDRAERDQFGDGIGAAGNGDRKVRHQRLRVDIVENQLAALDLYAAA